MEKTYPTPRHPFDRSLYSSLLSLSLSRQSEDLTLPLSLHLPPLHPLCESMAPVGNSNTSPSQPIPIEGHHGRRRSESVSESSESSASPTTPYSMGTPFPTPATGYPPRIASLTPSSPILSYFLSQPSPTAKSPTNTFPMRRNLGPPVIEGKLLCLSHCVCAKSDA